MVDATPEGNERLPRDWPPCRQNAGPFLTQRISLGLCVPRWRRTRSCSTYASCRLIRSDATPRVRRPRTTNGVRNGVVCVWLNNGMNHLSEEAKQNLVWPARQLEA